MAPKKNNNGGTHVMLRETRSWSDLSRRDSRSPATTQAQVLVPKQTNRFSFFGRRKGRSHSSKLLERGVLGKEGARVIISNE